MQFIDLKRQYSLIKDTVNKNINAVLEHGQYIMGAEINNLEAELGKYTGRKHCICCSSGTDALLMPLMALGIGKGDAVITTPFTFIATAEVISLTGATPVFVDIDPKTFNINPEQIESAMIKIINQGKLIPKAIIPVDLFGLPADYNSILEIADKHSMIIIEDAAQGFGGSFDGKKACSFGKVGATSFFPAKPLGCYGDGGAVFTDDNELAEKLVSIRVHGQGVDRYTNDRIGLNARMDTLQAAILLAKLEIFDAEITKRNKIAKKYSDKIKGNVITPTVPANYISAWAQYSVLAKDSSHRDLLQKKLKEKDVPTAIYYPIPLHLQKAFKYLGHQHGEFPVSEDISGRIFSLPMHPYLTDKEIEFIADIINK